VKLYTYHASSASYRVRIALEWKGLAREDVYVDLGRGAQLDDAFRRLNPNARVPFLVDGDVRLGQALAILEYLEERHPERPLLPADAPGRARVRELALLVVADTQPLQNTAPIRYLEDPLGLSDEAIARWFRHWISRGLEALEAMLEAHPATGRFCHGEQPTLADVCVIPQLVNWTRMGGGTLDAWPTLARVFDACQQLEAFQRADPLRQPDAPTA
jgi:maleylpyruvate isomerase